ncbi:3-oxoacyl-ACP synthase III family protein [Cyclobacterium marinum]|uniref:3-Oxoacyl-(Acyl-carrier-protein (ACP)) synthase III n=1 Tax=Cyclobacterium marinum (strain ATCC 25205 / DSM 745 / LMG 13164 / NCIMB 1802) TaxID=880070 RepID=G0J6H0_CYCMS|nr:ketoacyl-ACP synthase III [Cyclobacterium marinum]AEL27665.1 3-Oxoacyl-(acyl-carrier-protein (ACP)) synthase III [Cyclobacterium marinum DSM 745]
MDKKIISSIIVGSGKYLPTKVIPNDYFLTKEFYDASGKRLVKPNADIVATLQKITEIRERRYLEDNLMTSDMAHLAAKDALSSTGIDGETLDYIIVAHNFGDLLKDNIRTDTCPTLAARVKHKLGIKNPYTVAYDLPFGCPGWVQGMIQANYYLQSGDAKRVMVIGAENLSRISDPHDIDSMIFSDGAGAVILEAKETESKKGIIAHLTRSDTLNHAHLLNMDASYNPNYPDNTRFLKMNGRKLYEYAIKTVPVTLKECLDRAGKSVEDIQHVLIHQANAKMDHNILERLFLLYDKHEIPENLMPMSIQEFGNNSVATVPILYDLIAKGAKEGHRFISGDHSIFASVGAGMNINAFVYIHP